MSEWQHWKLERDDDGIAWLAADRAGSSTNVLDEAVLTELIAVLDHLAADAPRGLVLYSAKPGGFIAGADIHGFRGIRDRDMALDFIRLGQRAADRLEAVPWRTVAMIHGFCLGGGMELALACDHRVARDDDATRLGLPEVRLGIHPGFGGTLRSVRLLGGLPALELMLTGRALRARQARKLGLVDHAVPERHLRRAARQLALEGGRPHRPDWKARLSNQALVRPLLAKVLHAKTARKARPEHYPAPHALIDLWKDHADDPARMLEAEAESVARLIVGDTAQNLVRVFFLQERLKGLAKQVDFAPAHVHVVGAGVMGGDIAAWCALRGLRVTLQDQTPERIAPAVGRAHKLFRERLRDPRAVTAAFDRLIPDPSGRHAGHADLVIEAIFEDADVKRALYQDLEPRLKPEAFIATNTSSIPLEELAPALERPERLVGLHFFNPVAKMQLVEIVRGEGSADDVIDRAMAFTRRIDRLPLPVASRPGFLVNRILMPYLLEAVELVEEGVPGSIVDRAALEFGMPMGPIELADTVGLDICLHVAEILGKAFDQALPARLQELVEAGKLGRKSGQGFYRWRKGKPIKPKAPSGYQPPADITDRLVLRMLNETVACLREQVVADEELADAGMIFGTGFAPFRGGPVNYIRSEGVEDLKIRLHDLTARHGSRFTADPGWDQLAQAGED